MRFVIALVLILLVVPVAAARADTDPSDQAPAATLAESGVEETAEPEMVAEEAEPLQPEMVVSEVQIPSHERAAAEATAAQDMPRRGSFWWLVGVIVVAGVILAVLVS